MELLAHLLTRNAPDGWQNTLAPVSAADHVHMRNVQTAPSEAPKDPALASLHAWASAPVPVAR